MLYLRVLGEPLITLSGTPIQSLSAIKSRALLFYLALSGRTRSRPALADMLWGETSEHRAQVSLRQAVHQLRLALPDYLVSTRTEVGLKLNMPILIDAQQFALLAQAGLAGDHAGLEAAVKLYRGELLSDLVVPDAPGFEDWLLHERERLHGLAFQCLQVLSAHAVQERRIEPGLQYTRRLLELEPWHEPAHQHLMHLLAWNGQTAVALAQYERCRRVLADELDVLPSAETIKLAEAIRLGTLHAPPLTSLPPTPLLTPKPPLAAHHQVPLPPTSFVGRERELADLVQAFAPSQPADLPRQPVRMLTVLGSGGIGKTRLARQAAAVLAAQFPHGVVFVGLGAINDPALLPTTLATALGLAHHVPTRLIEHVRSHLYAKRLLLILDNCEHLIDASAHLADELLRACPDLHLLATSREALQIAGEVRYPLRPLTLPPDSGTPVLGADPATRLLLERIATVQPGFSPTPAQAHAIITICRRLDGVPLALELAAAQVAQLPVEQIAAQLDDRFRLLVDPQQVHEPRHQSLHALIAWSVDLLAEAERVLLRRLAVFADGWTLAACEAICAERGHELGLRQRHPPGGSSRGLAVQSPPSRATQPAKAGFASNSRGVYADGATVRWDVDVALGHDPAPTLTPPDLLDLLIKLVDTSLVVLETGDPEPRYRMLETTRAYAVAQLQASGEAAFVQQCHLDYWMRFAAEAALHLSGPAHVQWLDRLETEAANLHATWAWAVDHAPTQGLALACLLGGFWLVRRSVHEGDQMLSLALERAPPAPTIWHARALCWRGTFAVRFGAIPQATALLHAALDLARQFADRPLIAEALNHLGMLSAHTGAVIQAQHRLEQSLALFRSLADQAGCAAVLLNLAHLAQTQSAYTEADGYASESLRLSHALGHQRGIALALIRQGELATIYGDDAAAQQDLDAALVIGQTSADRQIMAYAQHALGVLALLRGAYHSARQHLEQSLFLNRERDDPAALAHSLCYLGALALAEHDLVAAHGLLDQSLQIQLSLNDQADLAYTQYFIGMLALEQGDAVAAGRMLRASLSLQFQLGDRRCLAAGLLGIGQLALHQGAALPALRLVAAALRRCARDGLGPLTLDPLACERILATLRTQIAPAVFADAWATGWAWTQAQAIAVALDMPGPAFPVAAPPPSASDPPLLHLPIQLSSFVDRATDVRKIRRLFSTTRLLTLTGAGGVGKTRLAVHLATLLQHQFAHGVCFVDLTTLNNPTLLAQTVVNALGLHDPDHYAPNDLLRAWLPDKSLLLVVDNCEHVVAGVTALLQMLLPLAPHLRVIATSREALPLSAAVTYPVPPLALPQADQFTLPEVRRSAAVQLFCTRAMAVQPSFTLSATNVAAVVQICRQLDGLPLAIELAAARISALTVEQIAQRLHQRLHILVGGSRSAHPHQRTLRATLDWSYLLLSEPERELLRRLAVFSGGATRAAIVAVAGEFVPSTAETMPPEPPIKTVVALEALVSKSLVRRNEGPSGPRYFLLETIREYAHEHMLRAGEQVEAQLRHGHFFAQHAEALANQLQGGEQARLCSELEADNDNVRAALDWYRSAHSTVSTEQREAIYERGLRMVGTIWHYWVLQGTLDEGYAQITGLLALAPVRPTAARAAALYGLAAIVARQDLVTRSPIPLLEASVAIWRHVADPRGLAHALIFLGATLERHDPTTAHEHIHAGLTLFRDLNDRAGIGEALHYLGRHAMNRADLALAQACYEESRDLWTALGNTWGLADSLNALGTIALAHNDAQRAVAIYHQSLASSTALKLNLSTATALCNLSHAELVLGRQESATAHVLTSLTYFAEMDNRSGIAHCLALLSALACASGDQLRAACLDGAAQALWDVVEVAFGLADLPPPAIHAVLNEPAIFAAQRQGRLMPIKQAIAYAREVPSSAPLPSLVPPGLRPSAVPRTLTVF